MPSNRGYKNYAQDKGIYTECTYEDDGKRPICEFYKQNSHLDRCRYLEHKNLCVNTKAQNGLKKGEK